MEVIKVSYQKDWDCEGYVTTQNITISENLLIRFNDFIKDVRKPILKKQLISYEEIKILSYATEVHKDQKRCLHLTQLSLLIQFLNQNHIDCKRVKNDRNTKLLIKQ